MIKMFIKDCIGWIAVCFSILSFSYPVLKKLKFKGKHLSLHCYFGYASIALGLVHALINITRISFSAGFICLLSLLLIMISGIIMKYFRKLFSKNILVWRWIHIVPAAVYAVALIIHITKYLLLA